MNRFEYKDEGALSASMPAEYSVGTLWHYTNAEGALGIIENGNLRASSISLLNDSGEMTHGMGIVKKVWGDSPKKRIGAETVAHWIRRSETKLRHAVLDNSFVASAAKSGEKLPLFLQYGSYAIGFNPAPQFTKFRLPESNSDPLKRIFSFGWRSVIYDDEQKEEHVRNLIDILYSFIDETHVTVQKHDCDVCWIAQECVIRCAAYLKDSSFSHEQEARLYGRGNIEGSRIKFNVREYGIVPYLEIGIAPDGINETFPIERVNIGPGLREPEVAKRGLKALLRHQNMKDVDVKNLSGTYR